MNLRDATDFEYRMTLGGHCAVCGAASAKIPIAGISTILNPEYDSAAPPTSFASVRRLKVRQCLECAKTQRSADGGVYGRRPRKFDTGAAKHSMPQEFKRRLGYSSAASGNPGGAPRDDEE